MTGASISDARHALSSAVIMSALMPAGKGTILAAGVEMMTVVDSTSISDAGITTMMSGSEVAAVLTCVVSDARAVVHPCARTLMAGMAIGEVAAPGP